MTFKQEARAGLTPKEALQDLLESAEYVEQRAQSGVNGAGNVPLKHEQTSVGDVPEDRRKRRQASEKNPFYCLTCTSGKPVIQRKTRQLHDGVKSKRRNTSENRVRRGCDVRTPLVHTGRDDF